MRIANLSAVLTGAGLVEKDGRRPTDADCGFLPGPIDILCDNTGVIIELLPTDTARRTKPDVIFDASGLIATAGWIDPHTHAIHAGDRSNEYFKRWSGMTYRDISAAGGGIRATVDATARTSDQLLLDRLASRLKRMLADGVTTVEVKSGYGDSAESETRLLSIIQLAAETSGMPKIVSTFLALHAIPPQKSEQEHCDEMISLLPGIRESGLASQVDSFPERGFFSIESCIRFSNAARDAGFRIKAHADEITEMNAAESFIELGAVSIDHLECISQKAVRALSLRATVATLLPATSLYLNLGYADARQLIDAGCRVALGSDFNPGTAASYSLSLTHLLAASQMRMSAAEIFCASTFNAAAALGLDRERGALMPGRFADILLWESVTGGRIRSASQLLQEIVVHGLRPKYVMAAGRLVV